MYGSVFFHVTCKTIVTQANYYTIITESLKQLILEINVAQVAATVIPMDHYNSIRISSISNYVAGISSESSC